MKDIVEAVYWFLTFLCAELRDSWDWTEFPKFLKENDAETKW